MQIDNRGLARKPDRELDIVAGAINRNVEHVAIEEERHVDWKAGRLTGVGVDFDCEVARERELARILERKTPPSIAVVPGHAGDEFLRGMGVEDLADLGHRAPSLATTRCRVSRACG